MKRQECQRTVLITLDGVGVGALADAASYGDAGASTLRHVAEYCGGLDLPNLADLGLGNIAPLAGVAPARQPTAAYGRMLEASAGKDSTTGHWEIAGLIQPQPFPAYPQGFPAEIIDAVNRAIGIEPIGNVAASGTEILRELGEEHCRSGRPIVYTSVDSVFQIAAHEEVISVERLYEICRIVRRLLDPYQISRVIAR
ncbi:MAG: phosphopentomutase, partial [Desulfuromonadaceae bacterium]|nr:phosphopentomutase [Desulfuromonadaceae bacterium]